MKKKVELSKLKVTSFVTNLGDEASQTVKGGFSVGGVCETLEIGTCPIKKKPPRATAEPHVCGPLPDTWPAAACPN